MMSDFLEKFSEFSNIRPTEASNYTELLKENIDLKNQKKELLEHIKRNEDLLFKAQRIITSLREEIENSYKSRSEERHSESKDIIELQDKLYISNKSLQETILRINENNSQIKTLQETTLKLESQLARSRKELKHSQQINKKLISFYKKQEKTMDASISVLIEENSQLKNQLSENSYSLIKQAENKMENLELNLTKIEENSAFIPEIEERIVFLQRQAENRHYLIEKTANCIHRQFEEVSVLKPTLTILKPLSFKFFELKEQELSKYDKKLLLVLKKLDFSNDLQTFLVLFAQNVLKMAEEKLENKINQLLEAMEGRIEKVLDSVGIIELKSEMRREYKAKKELLLGPKTISSEFKTSTFGKQTDLYDEDKENNCFLGNFLVKNNQNEQLFKKLEDYRLYFSKFQAEIGLLSKNVANLKTLRAEDKDLLNQAVDMKAEVAFKLERFIETFSKNKRNEGNNKHLPLRV